MNFNQFYLNTFIPQTPKLLNDNFAAFKRYLDVFYNETTGIIIKPVQTTGQVSGAAGKFVTLTVDNLIVTSQFTNLYNNVNTADYSWYTTYIGVDASTRNAIYDGSTGVGENRNYKYIDVVKPYYKITDDACIGLRCTTVSQIVEFMLDASSPLTPFSFLLDPCAGIIFTVDPSKNIQNLRFICVNWDPSWGSTWAPMTAGGYMMMHSY